MKTIKLTLVLFIASFSAFAQNFTWVKGSNTAGLVGVYGTQGVAAPANTPGGRHGCATWTDVNGNMWLFGGEGYSTSSTESLLNDLWKYNPVTNEWTWIRGSNGPDSPGSFGTQGVASPLNDPSAREFMSSWTDASGNFWLYGGDGVSQTVAFLADLWKYDPLTNEWTWMKGPSAANMNGVYGTQTISSSSNFPGGRGLSTTWTDNTGNFWMFGGRGYGANSSGTLNDLWRYDLLTNNWTWMSGSTGVNQQSVYGTLGIAAAGNLPGGRNSGAPFVSPQGNLVFCGGNGYASTSTVGYLNDMWEYDISTGNWKWISGSNLPTAYASFGTLGVPSATTLPGGRRAAAAWTDIMGNYWMFGGEGRVSSGPVNQLNDLFMYNPATNQWTWIKGSNLQDQNGIYGSQGVTAASNMPGARYYNTWWKNTSRGVLWLFGGLGYDVSMTLDENMNDLWKFTVPCNLDSVQALPSNPVCSGNAITLNAYNLYPSQVSWFNSPTSTSTLANGSSFITPTLSTQNNASVYTYYAGSTACTISPRAMITVTVLPLPTLNITGPSSLCPAASGIITAAGAQTYTWNSGIQTNTTTLASGSSLSVIGTGSNGCTNSSSYNLGLYPLPNLGVSSSKAISCAGEMVTLSGTGASSYTWNGNTPGLSISVSPTVSSLYVVDGVSEQGCAKSFTYTQLVIACVGIDEQHNNSHAFLLYPNPNKGSFNVKLNHNSNLVINNELGQKVAERQLEEGEQLLEFSLPKGIYFYKVVSEMGTFTGKLIIE